MRYWFFLFAALCVVAFMGARPMLGGYTVGQVISVDAQAGTVSVNLGAKDWVFRDFPFYIVDEKNRQVARIVPVDVYDTLFWSSKIPSDQVAKVAPGMQVRWIFTPEVSALLAARKRDTVESYRKFAEQYPNSRFMPELLKAMREDTLKELNPDYYNAWKLYTKDAFKEVAAKYPCTGYARAAELEIASLDAYDKDREKVEKERAERAAAYEAECKKRDELVEKMKAASSMATQREALGKLVNNSGSTVRFVFDQPSNLPQTVVKGFSFENVRHPLGSYTFKVFATQESGMPPIPGEEPKPLKEGSVDIRFDFWEADYP